jgi:hypothetical protein
MKTVLLLLVLLSGLFGLFFQLQNHRNTAYKDYLLIDETGIDLKNLPPAKIVGLQVGHWKKEDLPDELASLRGNSGAKGGGKTEWEINLSIAEQTAKLLQTQGYLIDLLPATVPPGYSADAFLAIHADANQNTRLTGFKASTSWHDLTGKASKLVKLIEQEYPKTTGKTLDRNITNNMLGYYAFSWWRFNHDISDRTPGVILETGFLTSPADQELLIHHPEMPAHAISQALIKFLSTDKT